MHDVQLLEAELDRVKRENRQLLERCRVAEAKLTELEHLLPRSSLALPYQLPADALYKAVCSYVPQMSVLSAEELLKVFRDLLPSVKTHFERRAFPVYPKPL